MVRVEGRALAQPDSLRVNQCSRLRQPRVSAAAGARRLERACKLHNTPRERRCARQRLALPARSLTACASLAPNRHHGGLHSPSLVRVPDCFARSILLTSPLTLSRRHELDNSDFGALPGAVPVVSREQRERHHHHGHHHQSALPSSAGATHLRFYQMQPQLDAEGALERQRPPWPPTQHKLAAFLVNQGGVRTHSDNGFARTASGAPGAQPAAPAPEEAPVAASAQRLQEKQQADVRAEATAPLVTANEDGRWYHMHSRLVPSDAPHVLATTPEERAVMAAQAAREAAAYAPYQPGGATPWPEQERWYTLDRHARVRQQEAWEVPPERGVYDEWNVPAVGDATAPRFYDVPERWIHMAPVDDGSKGPLVPPPGHGGVNLTNARPPEDGSKWYKIPNGNVKGGQWREC